MQKFTKSWALQMLDLNPDWMAIAVDSNGSCHFYTETPLVYNNLSWNGIGGLLHSYYGWLGTFTYDGDWKDTLVVRKCKHEFGGFLGFSKMPTPFKYCPLCGELLGSK